MSSIPNEEIHDDEYLYRGVINSFWKENENRVSSAAFKDSKGVSVDRQHNRNETECVNFLRNRLILKAVVKITAGTCRSLQTYPFYKKEDDKYLPFTYL